MKVDGLFTHFSSSDIPNEDEYTQKQAEKFNYMCQSIIDALGYLPMRHAVNSAGIVRFPELHYDMVRLGIGLYGFDPTHSLQLETVGTLKTHISQIRKLKKGERAEIGFYSIDGKKVRSVNLNSSYPKPAVFKWDRKISGKAHD